MKAPRRLSTRRQQADDVTAACCSKRAVEGDQATAMSSCQAKEIPVCDLLSRARGAHLRHGRWRNGIGPEHILMAGSCEQQEPVSSCLRGPISPRQLRADTDDTEFGNGTGRPTVLGSVSREPVHRGSVMLVLGNEQRYQHVDVEKTDHGRGYRPLPSARRSTSSTERVGAPGRRGKTGTPRSKRTSASAIRRRRASTNSSTARPFWPARAASRSFSAASTVIVACGIHLSLSHDGRARANPSRDSPSLPPSRATLRQGWSQIWLHASENRAMSTRSSAYASPGSLPWAQGVPGPASASRHAPSARSYGVASP